ncbi:MAG: C25 family cysteine peptidase [Candidatus Bathyarchaeia archaeon]
MLPITGIRAENISNSSDPYDLLIIGPETYRSSIQRFVEFKRTQGIIARYFSVEEINACVGIKKSVLDLPLVEKIHAFVSREYERSGIKYLLLVGTYASVPTKYVYSPSYEFEIADFNYKPTDWYYAVPEWEDSQIGLLHGNLPEIAVGRLPVKDGEELEIVLSKIIWAEGRFQEGSFLVFGDFDESEALLSIPYLFYESDGNLTKKIQSKNLFDGVLYAMSCSHGTPSALWTRGANGEWKALFTSEDLSYIQSIYGIHYLFACFTGALDLEAKEGEGLARALSVSPKGPALVIASARADGSDTKIPSNFWNAFFETGDVGRAFLYALRRYISDPSIFSGEMPRYQYYNFYLTKVIYGDISWRVKDAKKTLVDLSENLPENSSMSTGFETYTLGIDEDRKNTTHPFFAQFPILFLSLLFLSLTGLMMVFISWKKISGTSLTMIIPRNKSSMSKIEREKEGREGRKNDRRN